MNRIPRNEVEFSDDDQAFVEWFDAHHSERYTRDCRSTVRLAESFDEAVIALRMTVTRDWQQPMYRYRDIIRRFADVNWEKVVSYYWSHWRRGSRRSQVHVSLIMQPKLFGDFWHILVSDDGNYMRRNTPYIVRNMYVNRFQFAPQSKTDVMQWLLDLRESMEANGYRFEMDVKLGNLKLDRICNRPYYVHEVWKV